MGFLFAIFQMMPPMKQLSTLNNKIQESIGAASRVFEVLDTKPNITNIENPKKLDLFNDEIRFKNDFPNYKGLVNGMVGFVETETES